MSEEECSSSEDDGSALDSSVLGTKDYWDSAYKKELENFAEIGDEGTVWFGEDAIRRVVKWLNKTTLDRKKSLVLDLGSGNGSMLLSLATSGWQRLTGIDYSRGAVELSAAIGRRKVEGGWLKGFHVIELKGEEMDEHGKEEEGKRNLAIERLSNATPLNDSSLCPYIAFAVYDITLTPSAPTSHTDSQKSNQSRIPTLPKFDVILDKGTFDAISLCPEDAEEKKKQYVDFVRSVLKEGEEVGEEEARSDSSGGIFCLTSCNWTKEELVKTFGQLFALRDEIEFPSFQFGGKTGSTVTSLVFERRKV